MEGPEMSPKESKKSDPQGKLANPLKRKSENSDENTNIFNTEAMPQRFNLRRCQLQKKSALISHRICKGKSIVKQTDIVDQAIEIFQEEIIMEILSRLPVRSLHRFKCVSKFWKALISDSYFKKKHLNRAKKDENFQKFIGVRGYDKMFVWSFYCSSLSSILPSDDEQKLDLPCNFRPPGSWGCTILSSYDGLVLLEFFYSLGDDRTGDNLLLWNPSTRESRVLPHPKPQLKHCTFGLGYDTTSDDYKILTMDLKLSYGVRISSEILSLKSGSWRNCKHPYGILRVDFPIEPIMDSLAFVHGVFHWLGIKAKTNSFTIMTFNISNEVYGEMRLPEEMGNRLMKMCECGVSVLAGMLCTYCTFEKEYSCRRPSNLWIWVMKDYSAMESWTVILTLQDPSINIFCARPKYMYADGEVLLRCRFMKHFFSIDKRGRSVFKRTMRPFGLCPEELIADAGSVYTESLISPFAS